jgi:hypothetical protein
MKPQVLKLILLFHLSFIDVASLASMGHTTLPLQETLPSFAHPTVGSVRQSEAAESRRREAIKHTCDICGRGFTKRHNFDGSLVFVA